MEDKILKIKEELREIRKLTHCIETLSRTKERYEERIIILEQLRGKDYLEEIEKLKALIRGLRIGEYIKRTVELEECYVEKIDSLLPLDKTIIVEAFLKGNTYKEIGEKLGYSTGGIKKRIQKILEKFSECS